MELTPGNAYQIADLVEDILKGKLFITVAYSSAANQSCRITEPSYLVGGKWKVEGNRNRLVVPSPGASILLYPNIGGLFNFTVTSEFAFDGKKGFSVNYSHQNVGVCSFVVVGDLRPDLARLADMDYLRQLKYHGVV